MIHVSFHILKARKSGEFPSVSQKIRPGLADESVKLLLGGHRFRQIFNLLDLQGSEALQLRVGVLDLVHLVGQAFRHICDRAIVDAFNVEHIDKAFGIECKFGSASVLIS